jgi:hypothetical protein
MHTPRGAVTSGAGGVAAQWPRLGVLVVEVWLLPETFAGLVVRGSPLTPGVCDADRWR